MEYERDDEADAYETHESRQATDTRTSVLEGNEDQVIGADDGGEANRRSRVYELAWHPEQEGQGADECRGGHVERAHKRQVHDLLEVKREALHGLYIKHGDGTEEKEGGVDEGCNTQATLHDNVCGKEGAEIAEVGSRGSGIGEDAGMAVLPSRRGTLLTNDSDASTDGDDNKKNHTYGDEYNCEAESEDVPVCTAELASAGQSTAADRAETVPTLLPARPGSKRSKLVKGTNRNRKNLASVRVVAALACFGKSFDTAVMEGEWFSATFRKN